MKKYGVLIFFFVVAFSFINVSAESHGLQNVWAWGDDNADGCPGNIDDSWTHSSTVSLSRCYKNPSPVAPTGGSAFKNGPFNGLGQAGVETISSQTFTLPTAVSHTLEFSALIICVRCDYFRVELWGDGGYLGELMNYPQTAVSCGSQGWQRYCGQSLLVNHYDEYEIIIKTRWSQSNSLGVKWTGLELIDTGGSGATPTPTPFQTATSTSEPIETPTAVPTTTTTPGRWCTENPNWPGC